MTQLTDRSTPLSSASVVEPGRAAALTVSFLRGVIAACLGLGLFAVLVLAMWIISPYPDSGADAALRVVAALWLLAHGVELVRADTLSGNPAPLGVIPLLLMALPVWLVYRTARDALEPDDGPPRLSASAVVFTLAGGYLLVGAVSVLSVMGAPLSAHPMRAVLTLWGVALLSAAAGAWAGRGRPRGRPPAWLPRVLRRVLVRAVLAPAARRRAAVALRAGAASVLLLLGGGALLVGLSLAWHGEAAHMSFLRLASDWSGRFAVLLLALVLVPNAAMWGAAYGLGPGFALGTSATAAPFGVTGDYSLPSFPLLAAVPEGPGSVLTWAAAGVPVLAGGALAWFTVGAAAPPYGEKEDAWGAGATTLTAVFGSVVCAVLTAFLAAMSGGPMGNGRLAVLGPVWWLTGAAALMWTLGLGVPLALVLRAWRLRERKDDGGGAPPSPEPAAEAGSGSGSVTGPGTGPGEGVDTTGGTGGAGAEAVRPGGPAAARWPKPWRRLMWLLSGRAIAEEPLREPSSAAAGGPGTPVPVLVSDVAADAHGRLGDRTRTRTGTRTRTRSRAEVRLRADAPSRADSSSRTDSRPRARPIVGAGAAGAAGAADRADAASTAVAAEGKEPEFEPYDFLLDDSWHARGARRTRWAAIKAASGGPGAALSTTGTSSTGTSTTGTSITETASGPPSVKKSGPRKTGPDGSVPDSGTEPGIGSGVTP